MEASILNKKMTKVSENPFFKMGSTLSLFQQGNKLSDTSTKQEVYRYLDAAWSECSTSKESRELFFILLFSLGDVANREHNIFRKRGTKVDSNGGQSKRRVFALCLEWMAEKVPHQFYAFMPIIGEYYNLDGLMLYELKTDRWKGNLTEVIRIPVDPNIVTTYIAGVLKNPHTTENEKLLWARWLPHVPIHKYRMRTYKVTEKNIKAFQKGGHADIKVDDVIKVKKDKKSHTLEKDSWTHNFIKLLCEKMAWKIAKKDKGSNYIDYRAFRTKYLANTEAVLFSTGKIREFDKTQFFEWMDKLPSGARFRVACRVVSKDKSGNLTPKIKWTLRTNENLGDMYIAWVASKQEAQTQLASLSVEQKATMAPTELKQLEKAAKVNVAGDTMIDLIADMATGRLSVNEMNIKAHALLEKIKMRVPVLIVNDISGSMSSASVIHKNAMFTASGMSKLATTIFLLKNPDADAGQFFVRFDTVAEVIVSGQQAEKAGNNRFMANKSSTVDWLVDKTKTFYDNWTNVSKYLIARGGTGLDSVATGLKQWVDQEAAFKSQRIEMINKYPVLLVISDGDLNSHGGALQSFQAFQSEMRHYFGWEGVVVIWDVKAPTHTDGKKFEGAPNLMYFGGTNMGIVDQIFNNIDDLDVIDVYLPLKTLHNSDRYVPVKELVL